MFLLWASIDVVSPWKLTLLRRRRRLHGRFRRSPALHWTALNTGTCSRRTSLWMQADRLRKERSFTSFSRGNSTRGNAGTKGRQRRLFAQQATSKSFMLLPRLVFAPRYWDSESSHRTALSDRQSFPPSKTPLTVSYWTLNPVSAGKISILARHNILHWRVLIHSF